MYFQPILSKIIKPLINYAEHMSKRDIPDYSPLAKSNMSICWHKQLRRRDRFDDGGEEFVSVCPLVAAVARLAGVHF